MLEVEGRIQKGVILRDLWIPVARVIIPGALIIYLRI